MENLILSKIFFDVYDDLNILGKKRLNRTININELETTLENYLISLIGITIKKSAPEHYREIRKYFENIFYNINLAEENNILDFIKKYQIDFKQELQNHPLTNLFIEVMQRLYSNSYTGKIDFLQSHDLIIKNRILDSADSYISNIKKKYIIGRIHRKEEIDLPAVYINNIDEFEKILTKYIATIEDSSTYYNILNNEDFTYLPREDKIKAIFECTMLNATSKDLVNVENFFTKYIDFVNNKSLEDLCTLTSLGTLFDDGLYVKLKKSSLAYETPYYLSFMLGSKKVELPNVRLGIFNQNNQKAAYILATQTSQDDTLNKDNMRQIDQQIKELIPNESAFRFYNPSHLISLLLSFGILKGMRVSKVEVADYLPFRLKKIIADKHMNEEEIVNFQTRLTDKNMITYMKLASIVKGIDIVTYPEMDMGLKLEINEVACPNEELQRIYEMGYELGNQIYEKQESINLN